MNAEVKPGYKLTEVGMFPADWELQTLQHVCREQITYGIVQCGPHIPNGIPYIRVSDMDSTQLTTDNMLRTSKEIASKFLRSTVASGDIVYALRGKLGEVRSVPSELAGANLTQGTARLAPKETINSTYLLWSLREESFLKRSELEAKGSTFREITLAGLRQQIIPVPPQQEQALIATVLSDMDALISRLDQLITKKRNIQQAAMQQLLTGQRRLPGFSGKWEVKRLGELIELIPGGIYGSELKTESLVGIAVATTAHIDSSDQWNNKEMSIRYFTPSQVDRYTPIDGDLIVVKSSGSAASIQSGKVGFVDTCIAGTFIFSNFLMLLRPTNCVPKFLYYQLISGRIKKMLPQLVEASTYPNIRINDYLEISIPRPDVDEQVAIATVLSDMDTELATLEARRDKARQLKQGMMQELLTGRIRLI